MALASLTAHWRFYFSPNEAHTSKSEQSIGSIKKLLFITFDPSRKTSGDKMNLDKFGDESVFEDESEDKLEALEEINPGSRHERRLFRRSTDLTHVTKPQYDTTGRDTYTKACDLLNVIPAQYFLSRITQPEIDLSHRGLGPTGIRAIVIAMLRNTCITKMNVKDNALGKEGAKCLNVMFEQNYFVDDLDVAQNSIGIKGAEYFANTLSYSNTLKKLDLSSKCSD